MTIGEKPTLDPHASAYAEADFFSDRRNDRLRVLPSVSTIIHYDQQLGNLTISTDGGVTLDTGTPQVVLEDVTLNLGSVFDSFLGDTLSTIHEIVSPLKPVVDLLPLEIPLGGIADPPFRMIDIACLKLPGQTVDTATKVLDVIQSTIEFLETYRSWALSGEISFGDFHLTERFVEVIPSGNNRGGCRQARNGRVHAAADQQREPQKGPGRPRPEGTGR